MKAVILAGGFGTRLRNAVRDVPKPMAPILGKPFLEHQIRMLKEQGITEIILCVHYKADIIKSYFGNGRRFGVGITYSEEETPMGTAGAIKKAEKYIDNIFLVVNGDCFSNIDLRKFFDFHKNKGGDFTLSLTKVDDTSGYGIAEMNGDRIINFAEKSSLNEGLVNAGYYFLSPRIFDYIPAGKNVSIEKEVFPKLAKDGGLYGYVHEGYFTDIGLPETLEHFREDMLKNFCLKEGASVRDALKKLTENNTNLLLIVNDKRKLRGIINERIIKEFIFNGGNIDENINVIMFRDPEKLGKFRDSQDKITKILMSGTMSLPIVDDEGIVRNIEFFSEKIKSESFPIVRGKAPLRISFAGGNTDLPYYFEKYGGAVINATINKYCHASILKRADNKIIIESDFEPDLFIGSIDDLSYNGKFDLIKAIIKIMKPDFGFELYLYNDVPPGRGLGSSASIATLVASLIAYVQGVNYDDNKFAEIAFRAEREELGIKGGWQDQHASIKGGFNFIEFKEHKTIIYPLRLKEEIVNELKSHLLLCYVGKSHDSGDVHDRQEKTISESEEFLLPNLNKLKEVAIEIKDSLLTNDLEKIGRLLHEGWQNKRLLNKNINGKIVDGLYEIGLKNGAYGGKLLGAGDGGYILFFYLPQKRNNLVRVLKEAGGEILDFDFEFNGIQIWDAKR